MRYVVVLATLLFAVAGAIGQAPATAPTTAPAQRTVRVAMIGLVNDHDFWKTLAERFEKATHIKVETIATGNKDGAGKLFQQGGIDLISLQSADAITGLVADGWAMDAQPWINMDLALVGPEADPAGVKGTPDLAAALRKIAASKSPLLVHDSAGASTVLRTVAQANGIELQQDSTTFLLDDHQRRVLAVASERKAYTLIARIPFRSGKLATAGLTSLLEGDVQLQRPNVLVIGNPQKLNDLHVAEARQLAAFLRSPETQEWIAGYGKGLAGDRPLFAPVTIDTALPAGKALSLRVPGKPTLAFSAADLAAMPRQDVTVNDRGGKQVVYSGVSLRHLLAQAGAPLGSQLRGANLGLSLVAEAKDGYKVSFALAEVDTDFTDRIILVADQIDGKPLDDRSGPLRLVVPDDKKPGRWIRQLVSIRVEEAP